MTRAPRAAPQPRRRSHQRRIRLAVGALLLGLVSGCGRELGHEWARLRVETVQVPIVYKRQGVILSIDGHRFGPEYSSVVVPPGYHEVHAVFIDCALPMLVLTCLDSAIEQIVPFEAVAGETYVLHRGRRSAWIEPVSRAEQRTHLP